MILATFVILAVLAGCVYGIFIVAYAGLLIMKYPKHAAFVFAALIVFLLAL